MVPAFCAPASRSCWRSLQRNHWLCSCVASAALVDDEAKLSACSFGFTTPVLLTARGRKELDPL